MEPLNTVAIRMRRLSIVNVRELIKPYMHTSELVGRYRRDSLR